VCCCVVWRAKLEGNRLSLLFGGKRYLNIGRNNDKKTNEACLELSRTTTVTPDTAMATLPPPHNTHTRHGVRDALTPGESLHARHGV
jgi:hypothetical protein